MSSIDGQGTEQTDWPPRRTPQGRTPPGCKVLHVIVPESIFNHVKAQAYLSGMRFPEYVARYLEEACPYDGIPQPIIHNSSQASETVKAG